MRKLALITALLIIWPVLGSAMALLHKHKDAPPPTPPPVITVTPTPTPAPAPVPAPDQTAWSHGSPAPTNTSQRIGMNYGDARFSPAFLNRVKQGQIWAGTRSSDGARVTGMSDIFNLDANGYPTNMAGKGAQAGQTMTQFDFVVNANFVSPFYKTGNFVLLWTGTATPSQFTARESFNGTAWPVVSSAAGRIVFTPTPSVGGIGIVVTGVDASHTITSMALVPADYEAAYNSNEVYDPDFYNKFQYFPPRFMDWFFTNSTTVTGYPQNAPGDIFWNAPPIEAMVYFCNKANKDCWFNLPILIDDPTVIDLATRALSGHTDTYGRVWAGLSSGLKIRIEEFNEAWNAYGYDPNVSMRSRGGIMFPSSPNSDTQYNYYFIARTAQAENIWRDVWNQAGQAARVTRVSGGQMGDDGTAASLSLVALPTDNGGPKFTGNAHISGTTLTIDNSFSGTVFDPTASLGGQFGGQLVQMSGVLPQTYITAHISGTGNDSTWTVSKSQTVGSAGSPVATTGTFWPDAQTNGSTTDVVTIAPYFSVASYHLPLADVNDLFDRMTNGGGTFSGRIDNGTPGIAGTTMTVTAFPGGGVRLAKGFTILSGALAGTKIVDQVSKSVGDWCREGVYTVDTSQVVASGTDNMSVHTEGIWDAIAIFRQTQLKLNELYSKNVISYEFGQANSQNWGSSSDRTIAANAKSDPRMYTAYTTVLTYLFSFTTAAGGLDVIYHFNDVGSFAPSSFGVWPSIPNVLTPTSDASAQEYNALLNSR